ncbi:MAG: adenylyltransferase/cytidyltransferase family protein [Deltaproteobacteria bacterium]|nr:adenylyltransferase/cytidyltransferase family protein [Deltaproteobacteria bacterium]
MIVTLTEAVAIREQARKDGRPVALANGAFDLLHVGHLRYLRGAKELVRPYGLLIAGVNSDSSVQESKGPKRPIVPEAERAELVAGLACVDLVVVFSEKTAEALIEALRPDFHAKGTDYTPETVPERELVARLGGQTVITGDPKDHSTTATAARLGDA